MTESASRGDTGSLPGQNPESAVHRPQRFPPRPDFLAIDEAQTIDGFRGHVDALKGLDPEYRGIMDASPTVRTALESLFAHSKWTARHSAETGYMAFVVAKKAGLEGKRLHDFVQGATLHDMGKKVIERTILDKTGRLNEDEEQKMNAHPAFSYVQVFSPENPHPALVALGHHSQQDRPYPFDTREQNASGKEEVRHMLEGMSTSLKTMYGNDFNEQQYTQMIGQLDTLYPELVEEWKIVTTADVIHSLRSHRPYKGSFPDDVVREITNSQGFDPNMTEALLQAYRQIPTLHGENDSNQPQTPDAPSEKT